MLREIEISKLKLMAFAGQRIHYQKGEVLFDQGGSSDAVFIILDGEVDVLRVTDTGDVPLARLGVTELIGEMGVLCDKPRTAKIAAYTDVQALRIDKMTFLHIVQQVPALSMAIIRELSERLERANDRLATRVR